MRRIRIEGERSGVSLLLKDEGDLPFKLCKVFFGPPCAFTTTIQRVFEVVNYHAQPFTAFAYKVVTVCLRAPHRCLGTLGIRS
jgi:hypothetical protein